MKPISIYSSQSRQEDSLCQRTPLAIAIVVLCEFDLNRRGIQNLESTVTPDHRAVNHHYNCKINQALQQNLKKNNSSSRKTSLMTTG